MFDSSSPIPAPLYELMSIFSEQLPNIRFGDIDKGVLDEAMGRVEMAAQKAAEAESVLEMARAELAATQQALLTTGQRALAYARIYAEDQPALLGRLQTLSLAPSPANVVKTREAESKFARRRARKEASDEMPALPGTSPAALTATGGELSEVAISPA